MKKYKYHTAHSYGEYSQATIETQLNAIIERLEHIAELIQVREPKTTVTYAMKCGGCGAPLTADTFDLHVCGTGVNK